MQALKIPTCVQEATLGPPEPNFGPPLGYLCISEVNLGFSESTYGQFGTSMGRKWPSKSNEKLTQGILYTDLGPPKSTLSPPQSTLGPSTVYMGPSTVYLGLFTVYLRPSSVYLGFSSHLGPTRGYHGPSRAYHWSFRGYLWPSRGYLALSLYYKMFV